MQYGSVSKLLGPVMDSQAKRPGICSKYHQISTTGPSHRLDIHTEPYDGSPWLSLISLTKTSLDRVPGNLGKSRKEGEEDQGEIKELKGRTLFKVPWPSWRFFWLFPGLAGTPSRDPTAASAAAAAAATALCCWSSACRSPPCRSPL